MTLHLKGCWSNLGVAPELTRTSVSFTYRSLLLRLVLRLCCLLLPLLGLLVGMMLEPPGRPAGAGGLC